MIIHRPMTIPTITNTNMAKNSATTEQITIWGIVQGVGFRPFVTKLAHELSINGYIKNMGGFVQLTVNDHIEKIDSFIEAIQEKKPSASEIVRIQRVTIPNENINGFNIKQSEVRDDEIGMIPGDIAICDDCIEEFYDSSNPRYKHPFISCTVCGPRYTIIDSLPYDRANTTMSEFPMCDFCKEQYNDRDARRYHSQTISCHDCGPMPEYITSDGQHIIIEPHHKDREKAAKEASAHLNAGEVIALKGTGGYYFVCSPFIDSVVETLREIKIREEKPFAVMFKNIDSIKEHCKVSKAEEKLLKSPKRPIVLLERKSNQANKDTKDNKDTNIDSIEKNTPQKIINENEFVEGVCRSSRYIGAFLPSFGLQYQLIDKTGPLIMTSANLSDMPIIYKDEDMLNILKRQPKLRGVLLNRRDIRISLDDSVARVIDGNPQLTRRSKGYAPVPIYIDQPEGLDKTHQIFATGGQLKSAFSLSKGNFAYVSQYFGDLDSMESQSIYENNFYRMKQFFGINPDLVLCDLHPLYNPTKIAEQYVESQNKLRTEDNQIKLVKVQHHHAHTASVMAEHGLIGPVIGVSFDGTGYGTDGNIWGGEFLICQDHEFQRYSHLKYTDMIGGDSSMKEGWKSAVSHRLATDVHQEYNSNTDENLQEKRERILDIQEIVYYSIKENTLSQFNDVSTVEAAIKNRINTVKTSSMGRLFDAVASLLGIHHINRYEGECAIMLENAAYRGINSPGTNRADDLALEFHNKVAEFILTECQNIRRDRNIDTVALSGGVFQNKILMEKTLELLREQDFEVYYNIGVPTNDGGIALGQNYIGMHHFASI